MASTADVVAEHRGWTIVPKRDFGPNGFLIAGETVTEGLLAIDPEGRNVMPGATWFRTVGDARAHIDIYEAVGGDADAFWRISRTLTALRRLASAMPADPCPSCGARAHEAWSDCPAAEVARTLRQWEGEP